MTTHLPYSKEEIYSDYWGCVDSTIQKYSFKDFIVTKNKRMTFGDVDVLSRQIAEAISQINPPPATGVGIYLKDPCLVIPCMIGIMKSGNYVVVMDVTAPEQVQRSIIQDAGITLVISNTKNLDNARTTLGNQIQFINLDALDPNCDPDIKSAKYSCDEIAQILFTSGSSGKPKGAIKDYRFHVHAVYIHSKSFDYQPEDRLLQLSSFTFSGILNAVFAALLIGYSIYYYDIPEDGLASLPDWINENKISLYHSTPSIFRSIYSSLKPGIAFPTVRIFSLGGEKRLKSDLLSARKIFPGMSIVRLGYTGTEMHSVTVGMYPLEELLKMEVLPSGTPYEDVYLEIWNEEGKPVPRGEEGEIVVYSQSLARGYINNPELTRQKFIPDLDHPGWQRFKTGDLGKILNNDQLVHLGRIDNMTKIRGIRIELDTLEGLISTYPGVSQAVAKVFEDKKGSKKLVCYFVPETGSLISSADMRRYLAARLPSQQLPNFFISLDTLPLTSTGKLAKNELPTPSFSRPAMAVPYQVPTNTLESKLVAIWEECLGIQGVGVLDDFFDLGGDSLVAVFMFSAIEDSLGKSLPVSTLLNAPNIHELAMILADDTKLDSHPTLIPVNPNGKRDPLFFIPGKGGYPLRIRHLSKKVDPDTPVYAFQYAFSANPSKTTPTLEILAAQFFIEIKNLPHSDSVTLVGESMGGLIAYEIGRLMVSSGSKPPLIVLLDTYMSQNEAPDLYHDRKLLPYYAMLIKKHSLIWVNSDWEGKKEYLRFYRKSLLTKAMHHIRGHFFKPLKKKRDLLMKKIKQTEVQNVHLTMNYTAKPYPGRVLLVKATRGVESQDYAYGWESAQVGQLIVESLDCYHGSMLFEPAVSELAKIIQSHIK